VENNSGIIGHFLARDAPILPAIFVEK